jgi:hypothetical protein
VRNLYFRMLLVILLGTVGGLTSADAQRITRSSMTLDCTYVPGTSEFYSDSEEVACMTKRIGVESLDAHRARHESVVREIAWGQNASAPAVLEFDWQSSGTGKLTISDPIIPGSSFSVPFLPEVWNDILAHLSQLRASGAVLRGENAGVDGKSAAIFSKGNVICVDPRSALIETAIEDIPNKIVRMDECYSDDFSFADFLLETASKITPECKRLQISAFGVSSQLLATCTRLSGDKTAAADAWNASQDLAIEDFDGRRRTRRDFEKVIAEGATIRFDGAPAVRGRTAVAETFEKAIAGLPYFDLLSLTATATSDEVVIHGVMIGSTIRKIDRLDYDAPYAQIWRRGRSGKMLLVEWRIGKFTADES